MTVAEQCREPGRGLPLHCPDCGQLVAFEAQDCVSCRRSLGFDPATDSFLAKDTDQLWLGEQGLLGRRLCANAGHGVCNWLLDAESGATLCDACRHNRLIPPLDVPGNLERWAKIEQAKRRVLHTLIRLGVAPDIMRPGVFGLMFDFPYDPSAEAGFAPSYLTGHQAGAVTISLVEADDVARERMRRAFGEPYRTLVGHFRHELGHYYWHRLIEFSADLEPFRAVFGDERSDYQQALAGYHAQSDKDGWQGAFVSRYATAHPWEDFAETFAHYLHIVDTIATIGTFNLCIDAPPAGCDAGRVCVDFDPYGADTGTLIDTWIPLAFALNAVNRSMGQPDLYPFRVTPATVLKLDFINRLLAFAAGRWLPGEAEQATLRAMSAALGHGVTLPG